MPIVRVLSLSAVIALASSSAHAHGQDVFVTIYAQLLAVAACFGASLFWAKKIANPSIGIIGCLVGVVASWVVTGGMPYGKHIVLITTIQVISPITGTVIALFIAKQYRDSKRRI